MATAPYGIRLLVGAAVTTIEETRKIPQTILMYPMTIASQVAHLVMKMQQDVEGDGADDSSRLNNDGERLTEGRFALFTGGEPDTADPNPGTQAKHAKADPPDVVADLDYESLTLAQLRARLTSLRVPDLEALLAFEDATKSRAPFQTLLANRITLVFAMLRRPP